MIFALLNYIRRNFRFSSTTLLYDLLESRCLFCSSIMEYKDGRLSFVCRDCLNKIKKPTLKSCPRCGNFFPDKMADDVLCGECIKKPPPWSKFYSYGIYDSYLRELIHSLKFGGRLSIAKGLGELLAQEIITKNNSHYDVIIPIPLHIKRLRKRGFNQTIELSRPISKKLNVPLSFNLLSRQIHTAPQSILHKKDRLKNVQNVFAVKSTLLNKRILLIDDVMTTGATLQTAAQELLNAGALNVEVAVVARTASRHILN